MSKTSDTIAIQLANVAAESSRHRFLTDFKYRRVGCESPIEEAMLCGLMIIFGDEHGWPAFFSGMDFVPDKKEDEDDSTTVYQQIDIGDYRVDFLIEQWSGSDRVLLVVECDGHDFHERTKEQAERDRSRDRWMATKGITVARFTGSEIWRDPVSCAASVRDVLIAACRTRSTP